MIQNYVTERELQNALQTQLHLNDFSMVKSAFLVSDGTINFVKKS